MRLIAEASAADYGVPANSTSRTLVAIRKDVADMYGLAQSFQSAKFCDTSDQSLLRLEDGCGAVEDAIADLPIPVKSELAAFASLSTCVSHP